MAASFEFLADFEEWRQKCRRNPAAMDCCPFHGENNSFEQRTTYAALLKTLTTYEETSDKAKDSSFPRLVNNQKCGLAANWKDWLLPSPSVLRLLPDGSCLIKIEVTLQSPFFSRDDRSFYPTDNVLKRHHVFLTPYLAASGLKGLLRWAWKMAGGNGEDEALLFGKAANSPDEDSQQGLLRCWPVYWKGFTGLEVINPQDRRTGAGTSPIKYEVVLPQSSGSVCLLLVNQNNAAQRLLLPLMGTFWHLVDYGGLSAKNSAGWGQVQWSSGSLAIRGLQSKAQKEARRAVEEKRASVLAEELAKKERWKGLLDASGELVPFEPTLFTKKRLEQLGITPTKFKKTYSSDARAAYEAIREKGEWRRDCAAQSAATPAAVEPAAEEWLVTESRRSAFVAELEAYAQELATWPK